MAPAAAITSILAILIRGIRCRGAGGAGYIVQPSKSGSGASKSLEGMHTNPSPNFARLFYFRVVEVVAMQLRDSHLTFANVQGRCSGLAPGKRHPHRVASAKVGEF
jgi:hypothetical protein